MVVLRALGARAAVDQLETIGRHQNAGLVHASSLKRWKTCAFSVDHMGESVQYEPLPLVEEPRVPTVSYDNAGTKFNGNSRTVGVRKGTQSRSEQDCYQRTNPLFVDHAIYTLGLLPLSLIHAGWYSIRMIRLINPRGGGELRARRAYDTMHSLNIVPQGSTPWLVGPGRTLPHCAPASRVK